jgi:hypothetical protein
VGEKQGSASCPYQLSQLIKIQLKNGQCVEYSGFYFGYQRVEISGSLIKTLIRNI